MLALCWEEEDSRQGNAEPQELPCGRKQDTAAGSRCTAICNALEVKPDPSPRPAQN